MVDVMLAVKAQTYLFEAANARHYTVRLWERVSCRGCSSRLARHAFHAAHRASELARSASSFARAVGPENVIASTDCGLGLRVIRRSYGRNCRHSRRSCPASRVLLVPRPYVVMMAGDVRCEGSMVRGAKASAECGGPCEVRGRTCESMFKEPRTGLSDRRSGSSHGARPVAPYEPPVPPGPR